MTITAQSIIKAAQVALSDTAGDRFPASDLVQYLNMGQRDIRSARPDVTATTQAFALVAGHKQSIPDGAASLIDITANAGTSKERITSVSMGLMDAQVPNWRSESQSTKIQHFMHDARLPRVFFVYPPATAGVLVDLEASMMPEDVPPPASTGKPFSTVSGDIALPDFCESALLSMVLHYAYLKEGELGGNMDLAQFHMSKASAVLGVEIKTSTEMKREP